MTPGGGAAIEPKALGIAARSCETICADRDASDGAICASCIAPLSICCTADINWDKPPPNGDPAGDCGPAPGADGMEEEGPGPAPDPALPLGEEPGEFGSGGNPIKPIRLYLLC